MFLKSSKTLSTAQEIITFSRSKTLVSEIVTVQVQKLNSS